MGALVTNVANWPGRAAALKTLIPSMTAVLMARIRTPAILAASAARTPAAASANCPLPLQQHQIWRAQRQ